MIKFLSLIFLAILLLAILLKKNMVAVALMVLYITLLAGYLVHTSGDYDGAQRPSAEVVTVESEEEVNIQDGVEVGAVEGYQDNVWDEGNMNVRVAFVPDALMDIQGGAIVQGDELQGFVF